MPGEIGMTIRSDEIAEKKGKSAEEADQDKEDTIEAIGEINGFIKNGFLNHGATWTRTWFELDLKWFNGENSYVTLPAAELEEFIKRATTIAEAFELAKFVTASRLEHGISIPAGLRELMACYLRGEFTPVSKGPGRKVDTWGRDFIIARTMQILEGRWEHRCPTKRKGSSSGMKSVSQIVHEAMRSIEIDNVDVERIQKIYTTARKKKECDELQAMWVKWMFDDDPDLIRI
jgi:hypothetical protein